MFGAPDVWNIEVPVHGGGEQHNGILKNFTAAILDDAELIAPAVEGIKAVELATAMLYSSWKNKEVQMPLDGKAYERELKKKIAESKFEKKTTKNVKSDLSKSFA
jgi:hypothetical protein